MFQNFLPPQKKVLLLAMLLCAFQFLAAKDKPILKIKYGTHVQKLTPNYKDGTFFVEFYWWMNFVNDSSQTGFGLNDILDLQYVNVAGVQPAGGIMKEVIEIKRREGNEFYVVGLHQGPFMFYPDYKKYPFDVQELPIMIDHSLIPQDQLVFEVDSTSYLKAGHSEDKWSIADDLLKMNSKVYNIKRSEITVFNGTYNTDFGDSDFPSVSEFSRIKNSIYINRPIIPFITKAIIPLLFILSLTYMVFFLEADKLDSSRGLAVTSMFSSFAFQMTSTKDLPDIGYVIFVDKVFYLVYFLIAASIVCVVIRYNIDKKKVENHVEKVNRINFWARILFPIVFVAGAVLFAKYS